MEKIQINSRTGNEMEKNTHHFQELELMCIFFHFISRSGIDVYFFPFHFPFLELVCIFSISFYSTGTYASQCIVHSNFWEPCACWCLAARAPPVRNNFSAPRRHPGPDQRPAPFAPCVTGRSRGRRGLARVADQRRSHAATANALRSQWRRRLDGEEAR